MPSRTGRAKKSDKRSGKKQAFASETVPKKFLGKRAVKKTQRPKKDGALLFEEMPRSR